MPDSLSDEVPEQLVIDQLQAYGRFFAATVDEPLLAEPGPSGSHVGSFNAPASGRPVRRRPRRHRRIAVASGAAALVVVAALALGLVTQGGSPNGFIDASTQVIDSPPDPPGALFVLPDPESGFDVANGSISDLPLDDEGPTQVVSGRSTMTRVEVAAVMAAVTAHKASKSDIAIFGARSAPVRVRRGTSVLGTVNDLVGRIGTVGHATFGHRAIRDQFKRRRHDRAVMFTDDQQHDAGQVDISNVPLLYTVDLAGYRPRSTLAGFSDATFTLMSALEAGCDAGWPFEC